MFKCKYLLKINITNSEAKTLTNNTLISPRECFPSRATVGVESGATHIWSVACKQIHTEKHRSFGTAIQIFAPQNKKKYWLQQWQTNSDRFYISKKRFLQILLKRKKKGETSNMLSILNHSVNGSNSCILIKSETSKTSDKTFLS